MAKSKRSIFLKILLSVSTIIAFIIAVTIILGYVYEDKIKQFSIEKINQNIDANIKVDIIKLSFFSHFPNASLDFKNASIFSKNNENELVKAEHIYLSFDIFDIINENYLLKNVIIDDAIINLQIGKDGTHNFHIINSSAQDSNKFFLNLRSVNISNCTFNYSNQATNQNMCLLISKMKLEGNFTSDNFKIKLVGQSKIQNFTNENRNILKNKSLNLDVVFIAEPNSGIYNLSKGLISYQGIPLKITGSLSLYKNTIKINTDIKADNLDIQKALDNIPSETKSSIKDYNVKGILSINANINGFIGGNKAPHITLKSNLKEVSFILKEEDISFNNLQMQFTYNNGINNNLKSSIVKINNLKTNSNIGEITGKIDIKSLWKPIIKMNLEGDLQLDKLNRIIDIDTIKTMSGNIKFRTWVNASLKYIDSTNSWGISDISMDNNFRIKNANFAFVNSSLTFDSINAIGRIEDNNINISKFSLLTSHTLLRGDIRINNLPISLFTTSSNKLSVTGNLYTNIISFDQLTAAFPPSNNIDSRFSDDIYLDLNLNIGEFRYNKLIATNIQGKLMMNNRKLSSDNFSFNAFGGKINSSFIINGSQEGVYQFISNGDMQNINITTAFTQLDNFGQQTITYKNINGKLISTYNLLLDFDKDWNIIKPSIVLSTNITINNGELVGMTSLNALKNYTKIDDFSNISFSTLKNDIYIKDEKITIPNMEINSDKMNINLYGFHDFDNRYEYHFIVLLSEILGKHYQQKLESEFGEIDNDGYGKTRLFFTLKGKDDNFTINYDRKGLGKKLKGDLTEEKASLKNALKKEFGLFKTEEEKANVKVDSLKIKKEKEKQQLKKQEEGEFIIDWDDDDG